MIEILIVLQLSHFLACECHLDISAPFSICKLVYILQFLKTCHELILSICLACLQQVLFNVSYQCPGNGRNLNGLILCITLIAISLCDSFKCLYT